jgi:hypothetical protein
MQRPQLSTLLLFPLVPLITAACASGPDDDTYYSISPDFRFCAFPSCGGYFFSRLNRSTTKCHDGSNAARCYVPELDWSETQLTSSQQDQLLGASGAIVRGRFGAKNFDGFGNKGRFIVTEAWVSQGTALPDGVFVKAKNLLVACESLPCPSIKETALNTSRSAQISDIDFSAGDFTSNEVATLTSEMLLNPSGIIVAGSRYTYEENGEDTKGRTATAAYTRLAEPDVDACYVGGCNSELCSDDPGAVSTCDADPHDACYRTATCERQANGQCGWTSTPQLTTCLMTPFP